jgi:hypothetical protein
MLLIAAVLGWAAFNWAYNANEAGKKTGLEGLLSGMTNERKNSENISIQFGVGAAIFGIIALVILASGGGSRPPTVTVVRREIAPPAPRPRDPGPSESGQGSVEERLVKLKELLDKGLITEPEYQTRRKRILDDL